MSVPTAPELEADSANPEPKPLPSEGGSLRKLAMKGAIWTISGFGCGQILRLAGNLILTRFLEPELFGLMALAQTALTGLAMFSDIGTSASIVRHPRGEDPRFLNTAWTLQIIQGIWLFVGTLALSWPVAWLYGDSRLNLLIPLAGLNGLINGFSATAPCVLNRRLVVRKLAIFEISSQAISLVLMVGFVLVWPTIWGLVLGGLVGTCIKTVCTHFLLSEFKNRLDWDRSAFRELISFGKWLFLSTAALFMGEQADRLVLGKLLSFQMLGIYGVAANLADMPRQVSAVLNAKVIFPAISLMSQRSREEMRGAILRNRLYPLMAAAAGLALMIGLGDLVIRILYDSRYHQAAWILPLLALSIWPRILCNMSEPALFTIGRPQYTTLSNIVRFVATLVGLPLGYSMGGLLGAVIAASLRDIFYYVPVAIGLRRERLSVFSQDAMLTGLLALSLLLVLVVRFLIGLGTPWESLL